ncbi:MAG: HD domain-containing protein [Bergeyella sp.]|nr:HD domain-containing protein [Bergeyella sp.]
MKHNKLKIISDPVYGFIKVPYDILFDVMEHPYFQRLRRISQTGLLHLVFPGATHSRFQHALGAMHLMFVTLESLKHKGVKISSQEEEAALLAILMHDLGHGPFSHALENKLVKGCHHEKLSLIFIEKLNEFFEGKLSTALEMFMGKYHRKFFNQLISSQLDLDRLDYLKRDSFYSGVSEGNINTMRIISMFNVSHDELVVDAKGIYSIESFLSARMFMYWQVYYHKTAILGEHLLVSIIQRAQFLAKKGEPLDAGKNLAYFLCGENFDVFEKETLEVFTRLDDTDILQAVKTWQTHPDFILSYLCRSVIERKFSKTEMASTPFSREIIEEKIALTNQLFCTEEGGFLVGEVFRKFIPYHKDRDPIFLLTKEGERVCIDHSSQQVLAGSIGSCTEKYILIYPREIS